MKLIAKGTINLREQRPKGFDTLQRALDYGKEVYMDVRMGGGTEEQAGNAFMSAFESYLKTRKT